MFLVTQEMPGMIFLCTVDLKPYQILSGYLYMLYITITIPHLDKLADSKPLDLSVCGWISI